MKIGSKYNSQIQEENWIEKKYGAIKKSVSVNLGKIALSSLHPFQAIRWQREYSKMAFTGEMVVCEEESSFE